MNVRLYVGLVNVLICAGHVNVLHSNINTNLSFEKNIPLHTHSSLKEQFLISRPKTYVFLILFKFFFLNYERFPKRV